MNAFDPEQARFNMVEQQVRPWEVFDRRVLDLIEELPRDRFVPEQYRHLAYADIEIPLGHGQHMMFPRVEARLLQALDVQPGDRVLEIGTGSGYLSACLARLGGKVTSLEIHPDLLEQGRGNLTANGIDGIELRCANALEGAIDGGPFDVIAVTGSLPFLPDALREQLEVGGRLFVVTGEAPVMEANLVTRVSGDAWHTEGLFETVLTPLEQVPRPSRFVF